MESTSQSERRQQILYRAVFLIITVATPAISIIWREENAGLISSVPFGWLVSGASLAFFVLSFFHTFFRKAMPYIIYGFFLVATFSALYFSYINHFSVEYTLLFILTIFSVSIILDRPVLLLIYYMVNMGLVILALFYSNDTFIKKDTLVIVFLLFFAISNLNSWVKYTENRNLRKSEEQFRLLVGQMQEGLAVHEIILDEKGVPIDYRFISTNESFERMTGLKKKDIINKTVLEVLPGTEKYWIDTYGTVALTGIPHHYENYSAVLDKHFKVSAFSPKKHQFAVVMTDITEIKKKQEEIEYLSFHDQLTGLYNRRFYENSITRFEDGRFLPLAMVMIDVNGLKLTNDAFGHKSGDFLLKKVADVLSSKCREEDIAARIGGDEFVLLLPRTDLKEANAVILEINETIIAEKMENVILSISSGCAVKRDTTENFIEIFKKAEDDMYRHKLSESSSMRSKTIDLIMKTLFEKNNIEMRHSARVSKICEMIAAALGFDKDEIDRVRIAGLMHDIGKIGIYDDILNKTQQLNTREWDEIERHSETGYRILSSLNEFSEIADYVLEHHERWDGCGYPRGLKGEEISIQARIISVADAYDAMTSDRSYRKGMGEEEATREIMKNAGSQFDPDIAKVFIEDVRKNAWE